MLTVCGDWSSAAERLQVIMARLSGSCIDQTEDAIRLFAAGLNPEFESLSGETEVRERLQNRSCERPLLGQLSQFQIDMNNCTVFRPSLLDNLVLQVCDWRSGPSSLVRTLATLPSNLGSTSSTINTMNHDELTVSGTKV